MEVVILPDERAIAQTAANQVQELLSRTPQAVLGLATGSSVLALYDEFIQRHRAGAITFAGAQAFLLDEYVGLPPEHPQRYRSVIARELVDHIDLDPARVHGPDGQATDLEAACAGYEHAIAEAGGIDLQLLGIGSDGHIAFNEPSSSLASRTRVKTLTEQTRAENARFFAGDVEAVPRHCLTQGLGTILESGHAVLLATGWRKAEAVRQMVEGPVSALWPASVLQHHPHVSVLLDPDAASQLRLGSYYRFVQEHKVTADTR